MGYLHIENLYRNQTVMEFEEVYAMEKIHGTSAHIKWSKKDGLSFFSGGETHSRFLILFKQDELKDLLASFQQDEIIIYGEAYGGKQQGMKATYGLDLKFIAFDVKMNGNWLDVPTAETMIKYLKLDFVDYTRLRPTLENLNAERDRSSVQASRNGCGDDKLREGIVIRPIKELVDERGNRIIAKHKRAEFTETKTPREVDPARQIVVKAANKIASEWVTEERLKHILSGVQALINNMKGLENSTRELSIEDTKEILEVMVEDVYREGKGEIVEGPETKTAICKRAAKLYRKWLEQKPERI